MKYWKLVSNQSLNNMISYAMESYWTMFKAIYTIII